MRQAVDRLTLPDRCAGGTTYEHHKDHNRLRRQRDDIWRLMLDSGGWWTLAALAKALGYPEASISARLRDFRKERFGGHTVERRRVCEHRPTNNAGTFEYLLVPAASKKRSRRGPAGQ